MRGLNDLNREHDDKLKRENNCKHTFTKWDGEIPGTGRLICQDCSEQLN